MSKNIQNSLLSLDAIINEIGFGRFQIRLYFLPFLLIFNYITHMILSGYLLPALIRHWGLSLFDQSFLGCLEYSMQVIGSLLTSYSTAFGRRKPILCALWIWTIAVFLLCFCDDFYFFCLLRGVISSSSLVCNMLSYTLLTEVLPVTNRGKWLGSFEFVVIFGHLQLILMMFISFDSLADGNLKLLYLLLFLSMLFTCLVCQFAIDESPRFLCFHQKVDECVLLLDKIYRENKKEPKTTVFMLPEKKERLLNWVKWMEEEENKKNKSHTTFGALFEDHYKHITLTLFFVWFANCLVGAGIEYIFPLTLYKVFNTQETQESNNLIMMMFYMNLSVLPFLIPAVIATDMKVFGRKRILVVSMLMLGIACLFVWIDAFLNIFVWVNLARYSIAINYMILSIYTNEIYPTKIRSLGYGTSVSLGKIGSMVSPALSVSLSNSNPLLPYVLFAVLSLMASVLLLKLKYDTTNEDMDRLLNEEVELQMI